MNVCIHRNEPTAGIPWRCENCGSTLAITRDGECEFKGKVKLGETYTIVECPVCHRENYWYCNIPCKNT